MRRKWIERGKVFWEELIIDYISLEVVGAKKQKPRWGAVGDVYQSQGRLEIIINLINKEAGKLVSNWGARWTDKSKRTLKKHEDFVYS